MRDIETLDSELQLVAALRRAVRKRGGPLASIDVADALLDEHRERTGSRRLVGCLDECDSIRITLQLLVIGSVPR